jgi:NADPH:quinone reductase-like Zn-dependent oxidoreductase
MKAVIFDECGEPANVLKVCENEYREPDDGEVLVRMLASPVNPSDLLYVRGEYTLQPQLPASPGFEGVGVVEQAGSGLRPRIMLGKRVAVLSRFGGNWAERNTVSATQVIPLSSQLSVNQAATFFVNPATAYVMTQLVLRVPPGEWLLQSAANSTLGRMIVRLGRRFRFKTLCIVRREEQVEALQKEGATKTIVFDAASEAPEKLIEAVRKTTDGMGVPFAVDPVAGSVGSAMARCLAKEGRMLAYGSLSGEPLQFSPRDLMTPGASLEGFWLGNFMEKQPLLKKLSLVRTITKLILDGTLASEIGSVFPLNEIEKAIRAAETSSGKTLLQISDQ